jgi:WD40 repeat protein
MNSSRRSFLQLLTAAGCSCAIAQEPRGGDKSGTAKNGDNNVIEINDEPRVLARTVGVSAFSQDGKLLVVQDKESPAIGRAKYHFLLVDIETVRAMKRLFTEDTPRVKAECVAISPDNKYVVAGSRDLTLKVWNIEQGRQVDSIPGFGELNIEFGHTGKVMAVGNDNHVELWDWEKRERIVRFEPNFASITSLRFSSDDHWLVASGGNGRVTLFDVMQKNVSVTLQQPTKQFAVCTISPDGSRVAIINTSRNVTIWKTDSQTQEIQPQPLPQASYDVEYRPDGKAIMLITGEDEYDIGIFDANSGRQQAKIHDPRKVRNPRQGPVLLKTQFLPSNRIAARNVGELLVWELPRALWWEKRSAE